MANVLPIGRLCVGIARARRHGHRNRREQREQLPACAATRHFRDAAPLEVALENRGGGTSERRLRREAVNHRHVLEDLPHPVAIRFRMPLAEDLCKALGVGSRMTGTNERAHDLRGYGSRRLRVQRVAAEEIHFLQPGEEPGARIAAGNALHFAHGQRLAGVDPIRIELVAAIEVPGDEQRIATHALPASGRKPVGPSTFHELDEVELIRRHAPAKRLTLVGRIDRDRADGLPVGKCVVRREAGEREGQQKKLR